MGLDSNKDSVKLKEKIGYLSGNVRLYNNWTGIDHINFVESIRGKSKTVTELIEKLNFNPLVKFHNLSSGNKQKLGLILALMSDPEILIMDEPTVGLDPLLQNKIYEILVDLKGKGVTILISSHNLHEVEKLCDRVGIIKQGKMIAVEQISELGEKKLHKVEIIFEGKFDKSDFEFDGVEKVEEISGGLILTVEGDLNPLIKKLSGYKLQDIEVSHASLEDVFMKFYEGGK
jgi:ABC-2 type transport system ATP-binding protein